MCSLGRTTGEIRLDDTAECAIFVETTCRNYCTKFVPG